jgi:hypothetical protein
MSANYAGVRPSSLAGLDKIFAPDDPALLDFDVACARRLKIEEAQMGKDQAKRIAYEVSKMFADSKDGFRE